MAQIKYVVFLTLFFFIICSTANAYELSEQYSASEYVIGTSSYSLMKTQVHTVDPGYYFSAVNMSFQGKGDSSSPHTHYYKVTAQAAGQTEVTVWEESAQILM